MVNLKRPRLRRGWGTLTVDIPVDGFSEPDMMEQFERSAEVLAAALANTGVSFADPDITWEGIEE